MQVTGDQVCKNIYYPLWYIRCRKKKNFDIMMCTEQIDLKDETGNNMTSLKLAQWACKLVVIEMS